MSQRETEARSSDGRATGDRGSRDEVFVGADGILERACMSCGNPNAPLLVTWPYGQPSGPGRPLIYCDSCRAGRVSSLLMVMPLALLRDDPGEILLRLYEVGLIGSDPQTTSEMLGVSGPWVAKAQQHVTTD